MIEYEDLVRDGRFLLEQAAADIEYIRALTISRGVDMDAIMNYTQEDAMMVCHAENGLLRLPNDGDVVVLSAELLRAAVSSTHHRGILTGIFLGREYL